MAADFSPTFDHFIAPMIARAYEVLKVSRQTGAAKEGVIGLIVAARVIEKDMLALLTPGPSEDLMKLLEAEVRREIERIYTEGWTRQ